MNAIKIKNNEKQNKISLSIEEKDKKLINVECDF
jgi:hypothetical protein